MNTRRSIHPDETTWFWVAVVVSAAVDAGILTALVFGDPGVRIIAAYVFLFAVWFAIAHGVFIGRVRNNGVLVSPRQFPQVFDSVEQLAATMGLRTIPAVYVVQHGNVLNALAARLFGRSFVIVYAEILELAHEQGEAAVAFVLAHELAHLKLGHLQKKNWLAPARLIPFLSQAYSRGCEFSCDAIAAELVPAGAPGGLLALAAGRHLARQIDAQAFADQASRPRGFFGWLAELSSSHPNLPRRLVAVIDRGPATFASHPILETSGTW